MFLNSNYSKNLTFYIFDFFLKDFFLEENELSYCMYMDIKEIWNSDHHLF